MKRFLLILAAALVIVVDVGRADAVSDWNSIANTVFLNAARPGGAALIDITYVHIAIFDAVNADEVC